MSDLAAWLQAQGFGQYVELFAGNAIDREALVELSDDHLKELGLPLGHRVKLLKAIRELREAEAGSGDDRHATPAPRAAEAERRQLTVLFCDLVGLDRAVGAARSRGHGRGDPRAYHGACAEVVERWGGHVAKYMGDGVLAYFGWPQAHEDDAERAVRAGLALIEALAGLDDASGRAARRPGRHRDRPGHGRRADRSGRRAGADGGRRDAQPRGTAAGARGAGQRRDQPGDPPPGGRTVRAHRPRPAPAQGLRRAAGGLAGRRRGPRRRPLRGAARRASHAVGRARARARDPARALGLGQGRRRPGGAARRASRGSASRGSSGPCASASATNRIRRSATTARRTTPTARSIP